MTAARAATASKLLETAVEVAPFDADADAEDDAEGAELDDAVDEGVEAPLDAVVLEAGEPPEAAALFAAARSAGKTKGALTFMLIEPSELITSGLAAMNVRAYL